MGKTKIAETPLRSPRIQAFLDDLRALCMRHDVTLAHEDAHGAFEVYPGFDPKVQDRWLTDAFEYRDVTPPDEG